MRIIPYIRFFYLYLSSIAFVCVEGVAILVQLPYILKSLPYGMYQVWSDLPVSVMVRAFVTLFSAEIW